MTEPGERLAAALADRYRIERELGQGGMATVYLAHDLRHDRKVALKVLRPELAAVIGPERFLAEIKTTANLQHPHILGLIDSGMTSPDVSKGDPGGRPYYVMPYVEGESLRDRLARETQLPIGDAVRITTEVADALQYAHTHGVIHRDIKPENIMLHGGHALVADFGIALAAATGGTRMTETGMSLGTPHYMSPEQAMGERALDARTDIYALGCVLYEMLLGVPPFSGPTAQAIVAKVMTEKPASISARRDRVPAAVDDAVLTALEKLPADRFSSAAEFARALTAREGDPAGRRVRAREPWIRRHSVSVMAALAVVAAFAGITALRRSTSSASSEVNRFEIVLSRGEQFSPIGGTRLTWAPDGRSFAYVGTGGGASSQLWLRSLDALSATQVPGTTGATSPFFSPDGQQIGFITTTPFSMQIVPRAGGRPFLVTRDSISGGGGHWSPDNWIYFDAGSSLSRIRPDGTGREIISELDTTRKEVGLAWPQVLPGQRGVLCRIRRVGDDVGEYQIYVVDLKTRIRKALVKATFARYAPSGHLLYVLSDGSLMAVRFDLNRLEITGPSILVTSGLAIAAFGAADLAMTTDGSLLYSTGRGLSTAEPVWVGRDGSFTPVDSSTRLSAGGLALSPDGSRLAVHLNAPSAGSTTRSEDIWVKQMPAGPLSRLTFEGEQNRRPSWSHDGRDILFISSRAGPSMLYRQRADGSGPAQRVVGASSPLGASTPLSEGIESPDGRWVVVATEIGTPGDGDILALPAGGDTTLKPLIATPFQETGPAFSPDGRWLAYTSNETGRPEVYVRPFPGVDAGKIQVSTAGGASPHWNHRGDELFYRSAEDEMVAAELKTQPTFTVTGQRRLFNASGFVPGLPHTNFDVSRDDRRFLMLRAGAVGGGAIDLPHVILVQNFVADLRRLLP